MLVFYLTFSLDSPGSCVTRVVGEVITTEHVKSIRPGYGLAPKYLETILGKVIKTDVKKGDPVQFDKF